RGIEQVGVNAHGKAAIVASARLSAFPRERIGVDRLQDQAVKQDVDREAAFRRFRIEDETGYGAVGGKREPAHQPRRGDLCLTGPDDMRHVQGSPAHAITASMNSSSSVSGGMARSAFRGLTDPADQSRYATGIEARLAASI